jgi:hypothetical protein
MSKGKRGTLSTREIRRMSAREQAKVDKKDALNAFWALPEAERQRRISENEQLKSIQRNGITIDDLDRAGRQGYQDGAKAGAENTMRNVYAAVALTLHEMYGFGKDRCAKVLNNVYDKLTLSLTSEDAIQEVYDSMGLEIHFSDDVTEEVVQTKGT